MCPVRCVTYVPGRSKVRSGHIGYSFGQKGFREAPEFFPPDLLQIDVPEIVIHKADEPNPSKPVDGRERGC